jgi:hypothetical protein
MRLSLLAIMQDEAALVARWHAGVTALPGIFDEMVVVDGGSVDQTVDVLDCIGVNFHVNPFAGDFSAQRNYGIDCTSGDWIFELDADEIPSVPLLGGLRQIATDAEASGFDRIGIPRLNFHDHVLQPGPGHRGLDYQYRLHQRHCRWTGAVHEELTGHMARMELDLAHGHFIQHIKTAARFAERNAMYGGMNR